MIYCQPEVVSVSVTSTSPEPRGAKPGVVVIQSDVILSSLTTVGDVSVPRLIGVVSL